MEPSARDFLVREFTSLISPVLGAPAAADLCRRTLDRLDRPGGPANLQAANAAAPYLARLGSTAAFLLGEYDDAFPLDEEDWQDIRETLEDVSGEMDLSTLTVLMGELLSRGKLNEPLS